MKKNYTLYAGMLLTLLAMVLTACATQTKAPEMIEPVPTGDATELIVLPRAEVAALEQDTYADPFAYCAAVGTIDAPDARYSGPHISDEIINGFISAAHLEASTAPLEMFATTTIWRCMASAATRAR